jgi:rhodanese-related sulfurtransferase/cell shape-determining protein MreD
MNKTQTGKRKSLFLASVIIVAGLIPIVCYWHWIGRGPGLSPQQAWDRMNSPASGAILVDVRAPEDYAAGHIDEAVNWPYRNIMAVMRGEAIPQPYAGKQLILICSGGVLDALAARHLRNNLAVDAYFVKGGMQGWIEHGDEPCGLALLVKQPTAEKIPLPTRASTVIEQWALILSGFVIKPVYMILALILIIILMRSSAPDLVALRWSMIFFLAGEIACALIYLFFAHGSDMMEYLHSFGMVTGFGFAIYAVFQGMDDRLIHLSDPNRKCAALILCRACVKYGDHPCRLKQMFYFVIPAAIVLAAIPFSSNVKAVSYNTHVWGTFYNFSHSVLYQIYEIRFCPIYAMLFSLISLLVLRFKKTDAIKWAKIFFAAAGGALSFGLFRLIFFSLHSDNQVWFNFWEEATELIFVAGVAFTLWAFRKTLFSQSSADKH